MKGPNLCMFLISSSVRVRVDGFDGLDQLYDWEVEVLPGYIVDVVIVENFIYTLQQACQTCVAKVLEVLPSEQL